MHDTLNDFKPSLSKYSYSSHWNACNLLQFVMRPRYKNSFRNGNLFWISTCRKWNIVTWWKVVPFTLIFNHIYFREFLGTPTSFKESLAHPLYCFGIIIFEWSRFEVILSTMSPQLLFMILEISSSTAVLAAYSAKKQHSCTLGGILFSYFHVRNFVR